MPAQVIAGKGGAVYVTGTPDTKISLLTEWSLTIERDSYDASIMGDEFKSSVIGTAGWSGSCNGYFDVENDPGQTLLQNAVLNGAQLTLELHINNGASVYVGKVNPSNIEITNPAEGIVGWNFSFKGTGQLLFS